MHACTRLTFKTAVSNCIKPACVQGKVNETLDNNNVISWDFYVTSQQNWEFAGCFWNDWVEYWRGNAFGLCQLQASLMQALRSVQLLTWLILIYRWFTLDSVKSESSSLNLSNMQFTSKQEENNSLYSNYLWWVTGLRISVRGISTPPYLGLWLKFSLSADDKKIVYQTCQLANYIQPD